MFLKLLNGLAVIRTRVSSPQTQTVQQLIDRFPKGYSPARLELQY